jgi:hypothetical protein
MGSTDDKDLDPKPEKVRSTTATVARNATHLAGLLADRGYPRAEPPGGQTASAT